MNRKPWIGFVGMLLLIVGVLCAGNDARFLFCGAPLLLAGVGALVYALMAGHVTLFGR